MSTGRSDNLRPSLVLLQMLFAATLTVAMTSAAHPQSPTLQDLLSGVVRVKTFINPDARTTENLGRSREGSGVVIDGNGLVLTIGYLMVEAHAAEVTSQDGRAVPANIVGYDHETGFGLLRAIAPLKARPMTLGKSADVKDRDPVLIASFGGAAMAAPVHVVAKREFAGSWEYLLDEAIFTAPPHGAWSGAALVSRDGKLVGIGSLIVGDATGNGGGIPGNMFVPIDRLSPILGDLIALGRVAGAGRPWLGVSAEETDGRLLVNRVTAGGPAEKAGVTPGDIVVGVGGAEAKSLADFYRKVWAQGAAGTMVPLDIQRNTQKRRIDVQSVNRLDHLRLKSTY
jgi:S1-C subfamily serine protease